MSQREIKRIENWSSGKIKCLDCGKEIELYFNGGELDRKECCGYIYQTEHQKIDLVIYENLELVKEKSG